MLIETKQLIYKLLDNKIDEITDKTLDFLFIFNETENNIIKVQNALKLNKSVKTINLKQYCIHYYNIILEGLKLNKSVNKLKLYYNSFTDIKILSSIILQNISITNIKLKFIGKDNFSYSKINYTPLEEALSSNNVITKIKLCNIKINFNQSTVENINNNIHQNISVLLLSSLQNNINKISLKYFFIDYNILLNVLKISDLNKLKLWHCAIYNKFDEYDIMLFIKTHKKIIYNQKYDIPIKEIVYKEDYINYLTLKYDEIKKNIEESLEYSSDENIE